MLIKKIAVILTALVVVACSLPNNENKCTVSGRFYNDMQLFDTNGNKDTYYQFRSNDDSVWWLLTAEEIGCVPNKSTEYVLVYDNNGTTTTNKPCDCAPEYECECELYDDTFVSIREVK